MMKDTTEIPTFNEFNDYYKATNGIIRALRNDFNIYRHSEIGRDVVAQMNPFKLGYFHIALGRSLSTNINVFEKKLISEDYTLVVFTPGQIIEWKRVAPWEGLGIDIKESFLGLPIANPAINIFEFLYDSQPKIIKLLQEDYNGLSYFLEIIYAEFKSENEDKIYIINNLMKVLMGSIRRLVKKHHIEKNTYQSNLTQVTHFDLASRFKIMVVQDYINCKSVSDYANKLNTTPSFLNKCVKTVFNKTAKEVINEVILLHAKTVLRNSDLGIKEITFQLNFDDYSHFVKFFKNQTGLTPAEYRQSPV